MLCYAAGILAGALTRRVVPAMVATAAAFTALSLFVYGRFYYWMLGFGALRTTYPGLGVSQLTGRAANLHAPGGRFNLHQAVSSTAYGNGPAVRWLDQGWYADAHGHPLRGAALLRVIHHPWRLAQFHDTFWATYQPVSRFWLFQSAQAGAELLLALSFGALAVCWSGAGMRRCTMIWNNAVAGPGQQRRQWLSLLAWVSWRQHRATLIGLGLLLAATARGPAARPADPMATTPWAGWAEYYQGRIQLPCPWCPSMIGMFLGAPLLAREYAAATTRSPGPRGPGGEAGRDQVVLLGLAVLASAWRSAG